MSTEKETNNTPAEIGQTPATVPETPITIADIQDALDNPVSEADKPVETVKKDDTASDAVIRQTAQKNTADQLQFSQLSGMQQVMAMVMVFMAFFSGGKGLESFDGMFAKMFGFEGGEDEVKARRSDIHERGLSPREAAQTIDYKKFDFEGADSLLNIITEVESNGGDYDVANGNRQPLINGKPMSEATINEVRQWQDTTSRPVYSNGIRGTNAAGAFQIMPDTMDYAIKRMGLTGDEIFDETMQKSMATTLLVEKRGLDDYLKGEKSLEAMMKDVSLEWAGLPGDMTGRASYGGTSNNPHMSRMSPQRVAAALEDMKTQYQAGKTIQEIIEPKALASVTETAEQTAELGSEDIETASLERNTEDATNTSDLTKTSCKLDGLTCKPPFTLAASGEAVNIPYKPGMAPVVTPLTNG